MMKRDECLKSLAKHHSDEIVVSTYSAAFEWIVIKPSPLNYISPGAMGQASSHALGFALGRPDKRVLVLDGDGSLLMNLGSLVTIANAAPTNLIHFVCENGCYEVNGGHPIPGQGHLSFANMAKAAGYRSVHEFDELTSFEECIADILQEEGPVFVDLKVEQGEVYPQDFDLIHGPEMREAFAAALRTS
jgi:phosphonopyruvate decarboxylase